MTRHLRELRTLVLSVLTLVGCTVGDPGTGDPEPGGGGDGSSTTAAGGGSSTGTTPDPGTTTPPPAVSPCALQPGTYHEVLATTDAGCPVVAPQDIAVGQSGALPPGANCTASSTAACVTTIACSASSGLTTMTSTLAVTTGGTSATGSKAVKYVTSAPPGCSTATIFCGPPTGCIYEGSCYLVTSTLQCNYHVTVTKV